MRFRIHNQGSGYAMTIEDGEGVVLSIPTATLTEAKALQRRAVIEGVGALGAVRADVKIKTTHKKGNAK